MGKDYSSSGIDLTNSNNSFTKEIELIGRDRRVLDVGCHDGTVARTLRGRGCTVIGVEMEPNAARAAREVCEQVIVGDVEGIDLAQEFGEAALDAVLFGDVLEHLKNPAKVLCETRRILAPDGFIVASIPNIAHASIRVMLLFGQFDYEEFGILDNTHVQYFTHDSAVALIESCGYIVETVDPVEVRMSDERLRRILDPLGISDIETIRKSFSEWDSVAYQYAIKAFPAGDDEQVRRLSREKIEADKLIRVINKYDAEATAFMEDNSRRLVEAEKALENKQKELGAELGHIHAIETTLKEREAGLAAADERIAALENLFQARFTTRLRRFLRRLRRQSNGEAAL